VEHAAELRRDWAGEPLQDAPDGLSLLARGMGRSYGDSCLNAGNAVLLTRGMNRLVAFDEREGVLACEAGATLAEVIDFALPRGWYPPVVPGTRLVTLGGCVANDVHGKNHHTAGSFGNFVRELRLVRPRRGGVQESPVACSTASNPELFRATVGGLGLTGVIDVVELQLKRARNGWIDSETIRFGGLDEFFALSRESGPAFEYLVAWVDTVDPASRGLFIRGNHNLDREGSPGSGSGGGRWRCPSSCPNSCSTGGRWAPSTRRSTISGRGGRARSPWTTCGSSSRWTRWAAGTVCTGRADCFSGSAWCRSNAGPR
jgi:hypothetical protein